MVEERTGELIKNQQKNVKMCLIFSYNRTSNLVHQLPVMVTDPIENKTAQIFDYESSNCQIKPPVKVGFMPYKPSVVAVDNAL